MTGARKDLVKRGFTVAVVKPSIAIEQEEITQLTTWQPALKRQDQGEDQRTGQVVNDTQLKKVSVVSIWKNFSNLENEQPRDSIHLIQENR